jgi:hypothetical protein
LLGRRRALLDVLELVARVHRHRGARHITLHLTHSSHASHAPRHHVLPHRTETHTRSRARTPPPVPRPPPPCPNPNKSINRSSNAHDVLALVLLWWWQVVDIVGCVWVARSERAISSAFRSGGRKRSGSTSSLSGSFFDGDNMLQVRKAHGTPPSHPIGPHPFFDGDNMLQVRKAHGTPPSHPIGPHPSRPIGPACCSRASRRRAGCGAP